MHATAFLKKSLIASILLTAGSAFLSLPTAHAANGYLRYPDLHGDQVVYCAEGDLWISSLSGGVSRRLTTHPGSEYFPHFSPDGKWIAFTGQYDGNLDVFVVPAAGGTPKRLTWHPNVDEVVGWTPDGKEILFRSGRAQPNGNWMVYAMAMNGTEPRLLPLDRASRLAIDPESGLWAFTITDRERATWKRYRGGTSQDIWVGNPKKADFKKVTDFPGPDAFPSWHDGRIYFLSDEGGTGNIWSMNPDGSDRRRLTDEHNWDIRWPNMAPDGRIVFMLEGDLHLYDPATNQEM
ncbi:MAG TPA: protease, partial [bacterium]|nr:protease [bacterium]